MARSSTAAKAHPTLAARYVVPFLSKEDGQLVGEELEKIARKQHVNGVHFLDKEPVFDLIEATPNHPLRRFFDWNDASAARKQRIDYAGKLISSVQVCHVQMGKPKVFQPVFVSAKAEVVQQGSPAQRRTHVVRPDMLRHDPAFISSVNGGVSRMMNELRKLEHMAAARPLPPEVAHFTAAVRAAALAANIT